MTLLDARWTTAARSGRTMPPPTRTQQLEAACRAHGLAVTVQRRRIFEALAGRTDHPTPDRVYAAVKDTLPGVSRTTVYRVLETLVRVGVLAKALSPGAAGRVDPRTSRHHHLVCQGCDRLFDVDEEAVEHRIRPPDVRRRGFAIQGYSIYFTGLCAACRRKARRARPSRRAAAPRARAGARPGRERRRGRS
jgi:Fur family transcriptional regulator, peroxide stress response regulator